MGDKGAASASFDRKCAPSRAPTTDTADYYQLSYGQLHESRKQRGYHGKDTKAVLRTSLAAMDEAGKNMDTSTSVQDKTPRSKGDTMDMGTEVDGNTEKPPRSEALEVAAAVDLEVVEGRTQWRNP